MQQAQSGSRGTPTVGLNLQLPQRSLASPLVAPKTTKKQTLAAEVLSSPGYDDIVAAILSRLGWRDILSAGQVCQSMNAVVRSRPALQLDLRQAYYGLPDIYHRFDRGFANYYRPHSERLNRMIDVFRRWQRGDPATVHRVGARSISNFAMSNGLLAISGSQKSYANVDWNKGYHDSTGADIWSTGWTVYDLQDSRDIKLDPGANLQQYTVTNVPEFRGMDISRDDNVVLTVKTQAVMTSGMLGLKNYLRVEIKCYLLEWRDTWYVWQNGQELQYPFEHPEAKGVEFDLPFHEDQDFDAFPCTIKAGPKGTVFTQVEGFEERRQLWNWKTGRQVLDTDLIMDFPMISPFSNNGMVAPSVIQDHEDELAENDLPPYTQSFSFYDGNSPYPKKLGNIILPKMKPGFIRLHVDVVTDHYGKLGIFRVGASRTLELRQSYTITLRYDRAFRSVEPNTPYADTAHFDFPIQSAVCGHRGVTLEGPRGAGSGVVASRIYISDYRACTTLEDAVHASPLGCRPAAAPSRKPLPTRPQKREHRRSQKDGGLIPYESSDVWDATEEKGTRQKNDLLPKWNMAASGCLRTSVEIGLEGRPVRYIKMDADHLYICTGQDLTILSF